MVRTLPKVCTLSYTPKSTVGESVFRRSEGSVFAFAPIVKIATMVAGSIKFLIERVSGGNALILGCSKHFCCAENQRAA